jgi:tight adherence protein C
MSSKLIVFINILILLLANHAYSQDECLEKFESITLSCIQNSKTKLEKKKKLGENGIFELKRVNVHDVLYYKTSRGSLGKLKVLSAFVSKDRCVLHIDPETYVDRKIQVPEKKLLEINRVYNIWSKDAINLDRDNDVSSDLELFNSKDKCFLSVGGRNIKLMHYKNMNPDKLDEFPILYWASLILIFISVYIIATAVFAEEEKFKASDTLEEGSENVVPVNQDFILKYSRPFFKRYFSPAVKAMKGKRKIRDKYKRKIATAGLSRELSPEDFYAFKLFLIIGFPIVFLVLRYLLEADWNIALTPLMALVGFVYPDIWINGAISARQTEIIRGMPFIVDMLALSVEAGLDFVAAMHKVIEKAPPSPLASEFEQMIKEIKIGASRAEGLRALAWRTDVLQVSSFTATLIAADSVGASIGPILKTLSAEIRQKRSSDAEKKGAQAATKILFPMMAFIMPSVMLIIFAPMILQFIQG